MSGLEAAFILAVAGVFGGGIAAAHMADYANVPRRAWVVWTVVVSVFLAPLLFRLFTKAVLE